jgi:hypothetical protein
MNWIACLWIFSILVGLNSAGTLMVSPSGNTTASCDVFDPCTLETALNISSAGDIISLAAGSYSELDPNGYTIPDGVTLVGNISGTTFACSSYGVVLFQMGNNVTLDGITVTDCVAAGGAIVAQNYATFKNCFFVDSVGYFVGLFGTIGFQYVIMAGDGTLFSNTVFTNNYYGLFDDFCMISVSSGQFDNCEFSDMRVDVWTGSLQNGLITATGLGTALIINNSTFQDNKFSSPSSSSSVISVEGIAAVAVITNSYFFNTNVSCDIEYGASPVFLGGSLVYSSTLVIQNSEFSYCSTFNSGSLRGLLGGGNVMIQSSNFSDLFVSGAQVYGGVIYAEFAVTIVGSTFDNNIVGTGQYPLTLAEGGVVCCEFCTGGISLVNSTFSANGVQAMSPVSSGPSLQYPTLLGGVVYTLQYSNIIPVQPKPAEVLGCQFVGNFLSASQGGYVAGGALYFSENSPSVAQACIQDSNFYGNYISTTFNGASGGAVFSVVTNITLLRVNFTNNQITTNGLGTGGALFVYAGNFSDCDFLSNSISFIPNSLTELIFLRGAAIMVNNPANNFTQNVTVEFCDFEGNFVSAQASAFPVRHVEGGTLYISDTPNTVISHCTFSNNYGKDDSATIVRGGGIYSTNSTVYLSLCSFQNNSAIGVNMGMQSADFKLDGGIIEGGAFYAINSTVSLSSSTFDGNQAFGGQALTQSTLTTGGAVSLLDSLTIFFNCNFINNTAVGSSSSSVLLDTGSSYGGAVATNQGLTDMINCNFEQNSAIAGDFTLEDATTTNSFFLDSEQTGANALGGAVYLNGAAVSTVENCNFVKNSVHGGNYVGGDLPTYFLFGAVSSVVIPHGNAIGGAVAANSGSFSSCTFVQNSVSSPYQLESAGGGALGIQRGEIYSSTFSYNFVANYISSGGAIYVTKSIYIENTVMGYNAANSTDFSYGGAIAAAMTTENITVTGSIIDNNGATFGGGIYSGSSALITANCNFTANAANAGGGLYLGYGGSSQISNSIFSDNTVILYGNNTASVGMYVTIVLNYNYTWADRSFPIMAYITDSFNNTIYDPDMYVTIESSDLLFVSFRNIYIYIYMFSPL